MKGTIYSKSPTLDLVCFAAYMYAGIKGGVIPNPDTAPLTIGNTVLEPGRRISGIGKRKPGFTSGGSKILRMIPPAYLEYAGRLDDMILFTPYTAPGVRQWSAMPGKRIKGTKYFEMFVAFYLIGDHFCYCIPGQTTRIVSADLEYARQT